MIAFEIAAVAYHSFFILLGLTIGLDYLLATDKLLGLRTFLANKELDAIFGTELLLLVLFGIAFGTGIEFLYILGISLTLMCIGIFALVGILAVIAGGLSAIREHNLSKKIK